MRVQRAGCCNFRFGYRGSLRHHGLARRRFLPSARGHSFRDLRLVALSQITPDIFTEPRHGRLRLDSAHPERVTRFVIELACDLESIANLVARHTRRRLAIVITRHFPEIKPACFNRVWTSRIASSAAMAETVPRMTRTRDRKNRCIILEIACGVAASRVVWRAISLPEKHSRESGW